MPPPFDHAFVGGLQAPYDHVYGEAATFIPASRLITDPLRLLTWGTDASFYRLVPKIVAVIESEDELVRLLAICARCRTCEIGLSEQAGFPYHSIVHLVDACASVRGATAEMPDLRQPSPAA